MQNLFGCKKRMEPNNENYPILNLTIHAPHFLDPVQPWKNHYLHYLVWVGP